MWLDYHRIDPEKIDEEYVAALDLLWKDQALSWWQRTGRQGALCDLCNAELGRPDGYLHAGSLWCAQCANDFLVDGVTRLQQDPYAFGSWELWLAREFRRPPPETHLLLDGESLFSKFGFNDGDVPESFEQWREEQGLEPIEWGLSGDWHEVLDELVRTRLLPALDRDVEVMTMPTNHNPVRAMYVGDLPAEEFEQQVRDGLEEDLEPEYVEVPYREVEEVLQRTENGLFPLAETVTATVQALGLTSLQRVELRAIVTSMALPTDEITPCGRILAGQREVDPEGPAARILAAFRAAELVAHPDLVSRTFDMEHWAAIHRHLFQDTDDGAVVVRPEVDVRPQLEALRDLDRAAAPVVLTEVVPALTEAAPFTSSRPYDDATRASRRVLIQHALEGAGLTIDWSWLGYDGENFATADDLRDSFELAIRLAP